MPSRRRRARGRRAWPATWPPRAAPCRLTSLPLQQVRRRLLPAHMGRRKPFCVLSAGVWWNRVQAVTAPFSTPSLAVHHVHIVRVSSCAGRALSNCQSIGCAAEATAETWEAAARNSVGRRRRRRNRATAMTAAVSLDVSAGRVMAGSRLLICWQLTAAVSQLPQDVPGSILH
jgi:hypothetical protein